MQRQNTSKASRKPEFRSAVTNGKTLFVESVDGRSAWARRFRDLFDAHVTDLGGDDMASEAQRSIIRRCCALECELERLEGVFASAGKAEPETLDLYQRTAGSLRRLLDAIGIERVPRDVTPPSLNEYARQKAEASVS